MWIIIVQHTSVTVFICSLEPDHRRHHAFCDNPKKYYNAERRRVMFGMSVYEEEVIILSNKFNCLRVIVQYISLKILYLVIISYYFNP